MHQSLYNLVDRLNDPSLQRASVISWGCPIPSFGDLMNSKVATLGLNPSNKEFVDNDGNELQGIDRRFHTLNSLGINGWVDVKKAHLKKINEVCSGYFFGNPYDQWFKRLDFLISGTGTSFYNKDSQACHLDLIPYATSQKWTDLTKKQKELLFDLAGDTLGILLRDSPIKILILNGKTVVESLQKVSNTKLEAKIMEDWTLPRLNHEGVKGISYRGYINNIGGVNLGRQVLVLGYNHNIQSSFGVTTQVQISIQKWISKNSKSLLNDQ